MDSMTLLKHIFEMSIIVLGCISLGMIGMIVYLAFSETRIVRRIRLMQHACTRLTLDKGVG